MSRPRSVVPAHRLHKAHQRRGRPDPVGGHRGERIRHRVGHVEAVAPSHQYQRHDQRERRDEAEQGRRDHRHRAKGEDALANGDQKQAIRYYYMAVTARSDYAPAVEALKRSGKLH